MPFLIAEQVYGQGKIQPTPVRGALLVTVDFWERTDIAPFVPEESSNGTPAVVIANHGNWVVQCPDKSNCGGAQIPSGKDLWFFCVTCLNAFSNYKLVPLVWPIDPPPGKIVEILYNRKQEKNRNWYPGETIAMLIDQNVTHASETHDIPQFIKDRMQFGLPMDWSIPKGQQVKILKRAGFEIPPDLREFDQNPSDGYQPRLDYYTSNEIKTMEALKEKRKEGNENPGRRTKAPPATDNPFDRWTDNPEAAPEYVKLALAERDRRRALGDEPTTAELIQAAQGALTQEMIDTEEAKNIRG